MRLLPLDYPIRNLGRRAARTLLLGVACSLAAGVLAAVYTFVSGLESSFASQGRSDTAILLSSASQRDIVRSAISPAVGDLVAADVEGIAEVHGVPAVSPEIQMATNIRLGSAQAPRAGDTDYPAFVRGVTERAFLVHESVTLTEGRPPRSGEVIVGELCAAKLRVPPAALAVGETLRIENAEFRIAGRFAAPGTTIESEIWAPLHELKSHAQREDISCVFVRLTDPELVTDLEVFARRRLDLELITIRADAYYRELASYFAPIRALAWAMALMIAATVVLTGANSLNATVQERVRELATLRALGFGGPALVLSLCAEALLLAAAGGLIGLAAARIAVQGAAFRIGMGAFSLDVGGAAILAGFAGVLAIGFLGTVPASMRVLRMRVATALTED